MRKAWLFLAVILAAAGGWGYSVPVQADRGAPGSNEFGYGAVLEMDGAYFSDALALATDLPLDWLSISLPWSDYSGAPGSTEKWRRLDQVMLFAAHEQIAVMFSLTSAPPGAVGEQGPDAEQTAAFVVLLAQRYPALRAVELFPNANTRAGWGKTPDPGAYLRVYRKVQAGLAGAELPVVLAAAGLKPLTSAQPGLDMDDLAFLKTLLEAARGDPLEVISLDLSAVGGEPLDDPAGANPAVLRRYERVRQTMIDSGHQKSLLWITALWPASGTIRTSGSKALKEITAQSNWLFQASTQLRSQLYIGAIFYRSLNPPAAEYPSSTLIANDHEYHPFYRILRDLIAQNAPEAANAQKGRPKNEQLRKKQP